MNVLFAKLVGNDAAVKVSVKLATILPAESLIVAVMFPDGDAAQRCRNACTTGFRSG